MSTKRILEDTTSVMALAERLSACAEVGQLDQGIDKEAWTLAHAFTDLEDLFESF